MSEDNDKNIQSGQGLKKTKRSTGKYLSNSTVMTKRKVYKFWICWFWMVEAKKLGLVGLVGLGVAGLVGGCTPEGKAVINVLGIQAGRSVIRREIEGPRGEENGEVDGKEDSSVTYRLPEPRIRMKRWKDYDGNGDMNDSELFGEIDSSINLKNMGLYVDIGFYSHRPEPVTYTLVDSNDNILETKTLVRDSFRIGENSNLKPGDYSISAKQKNELVGDIDLSRKFIIL